jgi:hypothetical protein
MNIQKKLAILFARGGTCNAERLLPELVENDQLITNRQFNDHLKFLYLYSDLLAYYDTNNQKIDQNVWRTFLEQDDTVMRSLILHTNIDKVKKNIQKSVLTLRRQDAGIADGAHMSGILVVAREILVLLDYWHKNLSNDDLIRTKLDVLIHEELNMHISNVYRILLQHSKQQDIPSFDDFCAFVDQLCAGSALWELKGSLIYDPLTNVNVTGEHSIDCLDDFFDVLFKIVYQLKELAANDYFDTLHTQNKNPHIALLFAFLQLLNHAEAHLNYVPERALNHYYRNILKLNNNPSTPDKAYVHFDLSPGFEFAFVPRGTRLVTQNPINGEDILFETDTDLTVNKAKIKQINVLLAQKNSNAHDQTMELSAVTYTEEALETLPFQLLPTPGVKHILPKQAGKRLAFLVSSPLFYLSEGMRTITLLCKLTAGSFHQLLRQNTDRENGSNEACLADLAEQLTAIVHVRVTTQTGWFSVENKEITVEFLPQTHSISFVIRLCPDLPAIDKLEIGDQDGFPNMDAPALSIGVQHDTPLMELSMFNELVVEKVDLKVHVQGHRGLILQNQLGIIDNSQLIEPFGPLPKVGSSFYIGSGEVFSKNLTELQLNIKWEELPAIEGGFKRYYEAYPTQVHNEDFKVSIAYLNHHHWNPSYAPARQTVPLFQVVKANNKGNEKLDIFRTIDHIDVARLGITKSNDPLDVVIYAPNTIAGFLKLQLCGPEQAFGHAVYPSLMSNVLVENIKKKQAGPAVLCNEPYTPRIKSITVDYEAVDSIVLTAPPGSETQQYATNLFHITSFGYTKIFPKRTAVPISFLPVEQAQTCFMALGIADCNGSTITMHIEIGGTILESDREEHKPCWLYLSEDVWVPFKEESIVVDGTNGCTQSGIIVFDLPSKATQNNTHMAPGLIWIKACFFGDIEALPTIMGVYVQATPVSRILDRNGVFSTPVLPERSIQDLQEPIEGIENVVQPFKTFNGRQYENHQAFYRRVSERLRHKNRAISAWDYERLVLEKFPEVFRVQCLNHTVKRFPNSIRPGHVTLVIIVKATNMTLDKLPLASASLLAEIKSYIRSVSAPFIRFDVINPVYEDMKVSITVRFKPGHERGLYLHTLQQDLRNFLSPWLLDPSKGIQLGGTMPTSQVVDFINNRPYIEGIGNFSILKYVGTKSNLKLDRVTEYDSCLCATYPWSVIVSAKRHSISAVDNFDDRVKLRKGSLGDMAIGEDFIIGPWAQKPAIESVVYEDQDVFVPSSEEHYLITKKYIQKDHGDYE